MGLLERIGQLFGGKKRPTLKQLPLDTLKREQLTVQHELNNLEKENEKLEKTESQYKEEYRAAHAAGRDSLKRSVAQKLQVHRMRRKGIDTQLAYTNKMFQTVTGMLIIKENMAFFERLGVGSVISNMDLGELENYVTEATVEGTLQQEKLAAMLQGITTGVERLSGVSQDTGIGDLMAELDAELLDGQQTTDAIPVAERVAVRHGLDSAGIDTVIQNAEELNARAERGADAARRLHQTIPTPQNDARQENES